MGYDIHITRADNWSENDAQQISMQEWLEYVEFDNELTTDPNNGSKFAIWSAHPSEPETWICWDDGNIFTKAPDEPLLRKMLAIADHLNARVQGDDGEIYDPENLPEVFSPSGGSNLLHYFPFIGSIIAAACLLPLPTLDSFFRSRLIPGEMLSWSQIGALVTLMVLGGICLIVSTVLALMAMTDGKHRLSYLALVLNILTVSVLFVTL